VQSLMARPAAAPGRIVGKGERSHQAQGSDDLAHPLLLLGPRHRAGQAQGGRVVQGLPHGEGLVQKVVLEDKAERPLRALGHGRPVEEDAAGDGGAPKKNGGGGGGGGGGGEGERGACESAAREQRQGAGP